MWIYVLFHKNAFNKNSAGFTTSTIYSRYWKTSPLRGHPQQSIFIKRHQRWLVVTCGWPFKGILSRVTNIAMVCNHKNQISSKPQNPTRYFLWKRVPGLIWREKSLFEHFYIKTLNWNDLGFIIQKKWFLKRHQQGDWLWWLWLVGDISRTSKSRVAGSLT